jgi:hypothetical protein
MLLRKDSRERFAEFNEELEQLTALRELRDEKHHRAVVERP